MAEDWGRLSRIDKVVSIAGLVVPLVTGVLEGVPWTYRIPAMAVTACAALFLWRHLTLRRLLMPGVLQAIYENDLLTPDELFGGRSRVSNITFRNTEFKGPGAVYIEGDCRLTDPLFNPHINALLIMPQSYASLLPFYRINNSVFDRCIFSGVGLLVDSKNSHLFGLQPEQTQPNLPLVNPPHQGYQQNVDVNPPDRPSSGVDDVQR
jgi:hypothetical protein